MPVHYVGVDIAKASIEHTAAKPGALANTGPVLKDWLSALKSKHPGVHVICEATGGYERALAGAAAANGVGLTIANPAQVRAFARSLGRLEKTDAIDAEVLRLYGERLQPKESAPINPRLAELQEWVRARDHYLERKLAEENRLEHLSVPGVVKLARREILRLEKLIEELESRIDSFLETEAPELSDQVQTLCLVCGVAARTAVNVIAHLPELGRCHDAQIAKLAGLAPLNQDSGRRRGQRHIRGGRAAARKALYQAAVVAARHNPVLAPFYQRLRASGKPPKLAFTAVARKLLLFLNKLLKPAYLLPP